jgi:hypothetical protein
MIDFKAFETIAHTRQPFAEYISEMPLNGWSLENLGVASDPQYNIYGMELNSNQAGKPYIMLRSSVHGNEWESAYWCRYFAKFLGEPNTAPTQLQSYFINLKLNYNWYWVPIHNPWGYENNKRENNNNINLNDDIGTLSQIENIYLVNKFNALKPVSMVDNHSWENSSAPCHAMSIYRDGQYDRTVSQELLFHALKNIQCITNQKTNHYNSSSHDPTKFRAWTARQKSGSGINCMSFLIETYRYAPVNTQIKQGFNALLIFMIYFDIWYKKAIQNPVNSDLVYST